MTEEQSRVPHPEGVDTDARGDAYQDMMEALLANSRIDGAIVMDDEQQLSDLQRQQIRARYNKLRTDGEATHYRAGQAIDENKSLISQIANDRYGQGKTRGMRTIDRVLRKLDKFMSQRDATAQAPKRSGFTWIKVAEEIRAVAHTIVQLLTIGVVYGQAGIGKTLTLGALLATFPGSVLITITDGSDSVPSFLKELARLLKLEPAGCRSENRRAICERLTGSGRLLIIDEAHLASAMLLNAIRQIHDEAGVPVLLAGQPSLARKLLQGRGDDHVGAMLFSRVGLVRDLEARCKGDLGEPLYTVADIRKVFAKSRMRIARDAMDWIAGLSNMPDAGGLRAAGNTLRLAEVIAAKSVKPVYEITLERLQQACRNLCGQERARAIAKRIKEQTNVA